MSHEADDDMGYDPSNFVFTEWLGSKNFKYKTMDHYTKKALWIYWIRGDDEVELTDEEFSNNEDEVFRIDTNIFDFETPMCKTFKECNYLLQIDPDLLTKNIEGFKTYGEYKDDWIYEWNRDRAKEQALRNKAIIEGLISDDESSNDGWRRWESHEITYHDHDEIEYEKETHDERQELCEAHELPVCNIRRFKMINYSFGQDKEYVTLKEDEYDNLARTSGDECQAYQEIFRMIDEGWMVTRAE
nr:VIER F-box protein 2 [Tanacetum cinerariifolium]